MTHTTATENTPALPSAAMARANDLFRAEPETGIVMLTDGVTTLGPDFQIAALEAVRAFDGFAHEDDPYGNHDFGIVTVAGQRLYWKIDVYPNDGLWYGNGAPPEGEAVRALTIMLPEEY